MLEDIATLLTADVVTTTGNHGHAKTHNQHSLGILHSIVMLLAHSPHDGILLALLYSRNATAPPAVAFHSSSTGITAQLSSSAMTQTLSSLYSDTCASRRTALAPARTVRGAVARELDGLVAIGEGAEFAFGAVGDANSTLDDAIIAALVSTFATDAFGFPSAGTR